MCLEVKSVGKPDAVAPHVRFDERGWETGLYATAPVLDSTGVRIPRILETVVDFVTKSFVWKIAGDDEINYISTEFEL